MTTPSLIRTKKMTKPMTDERIIMGTKEALADEIYRLQSDNARLSRDEKSLQRFVAQLQEENERLKALVNGDDFK